MRYALNLKFLHCFYGIKGSQIEFLAGVFGLGNAFIKRHTHLVPGTSGRDAQSFIGIKGVSVVIEHDVERKAR